MRNISRLVAVSSAMTMAGVLATNVAADELITNGDFETGDSSGWTVTIKPGSLDTNFSIVPPGTEVPLSEDPTALNPDGGDFYAVSSQNGPGTIALSQPFTVPAGVTSVTLTFQMFVNDWNEEGAQIHEHFDHDFEPNQHARVDILRVGAGPFDTGDTVLGNLYLGVDEGGSNPYDYTDHSFDITNIVATAGTYILRFAEVDNQMFFNMGIDNVSIQAEGGSGIAAATCDVYGMQDYGLNNSQLFSVGGGAIGPVQSGRDIESIDIDPKTNIIYGSSGRHTAKKGHLYRIDANTGALHSVGATGFEEVDSISFLPNVGGLYGWARGDGGGLIEIDTNTGAGTLIWSPGTDAEDITFDIKGNYLYGAVGSTLWVTDSSLEAAKHHCDLPLASGSAVEGLEMVQHPNYNNGEEFLLVGINDDTSNIVTMNIDTCEPVVPNIPVPFDDVEGLAFESGTCSEEVAAPADVQSINSGEPMPIPKVHVPY